MFFSEKISFYNVSVLDPNIATPTISWILNSLINMAFEQTGQYNIKNDVTYYTSKTGV